MEPIPNDILHKIVKTGLLLFLFLSQRRIEIIPLSGSLLIGATAEKNYILYLHIYLKKIILSTD